MGVFCSQPKVLRTQIVVKLSRTLDPYQFPSAQDVNAKLISEYRLPVYLWDTKGFPFFTIPFSGIQISIPLTVIRQSLPKLLFVVSRI